MFRRVLRDVKWRVPSALPLRQRRALWYLLSFRRRGDFENPKRFSEKVNWRILNDRSPELAWTCDKLAMKERVRELAPGIRVPRVLWSGTDVAEFASMDLPERWVLKPNHGSYKVHIGTGRPDLEDLKRVTAHWLEPWQDKVLGEWAYSLARRAIYAEEWLGGAESPTDYKVFVFDGEPLYVETVHNRYSNHTERFYTADWQALDVRTDGVLAPVLPRPANLDRLLGHAAAIGRGFGFMRVDLYDIDGEVWFGETSPYPDGGLEPWHPDSFDLTLGDAWRIGDREPLGA